MERILQVNAIPEKIHEISRLHPVNRHEKRVHFGMLQQLFAVFGEPLRVRANLAEEILCRLDVLLGPGKRFPFHDSCMKEVEIRVATINPGNVKTSMDVQQLLTGRKGFLCLAVIG